jgi:hypothetical protein
MYNFNNVSSPYPVSVAASYQHSNEGKMTSLTYPGGTYAYDNMVSAGPPVRSFSLA